VRGVCAPWIGEISVWRRRRKREAKYERESERVKKEKEEGREKVAIYMG
jgi:hypothetical protein